MAFLWIERVVIIFFYHSNDFESFCFLLTFLFHCGNIHTKRYKWHRWKKNLKFHADLFYSSFFLWKQKPNIMTDGLIKLAILLLHALWCVLIEVALVSCVAKPIIYFIWIFVECRVCEHKSGPTRENNGNWPEFKNCAFEWDALIDLKYPMKLFASLLFN